SGAKMADIRGAGESDIRRAGRWTNDALESAYLTNLPRVLLRVMTGFYKDGGHFYLRRAIEKPEPELCRKVFPMVEVWQERMNQGCDHGDQSIAADGFLQMLRQLSIVFLPDSVPLQELYPRLKLARSMNEAPTPQDLTLQMAMPLMHDYVRPIHTYVSSRLATLTRNVEQQAQRTSQFLDDLISGRVPFSLQLDPSYIQNSHSTASNVIIPAQHTNNTSTNNTIITLNTTTDPPYYKMSRGITNIYNLWHEWHIGLSGSPAVLELERTWENQVTKRW
ncbi:hypothetical protein INT45_008847, partial [Circinella minor]